MDDPLTDAKRRVSRKFLGAANIHAVGVHPTAADTIMVHRAVKEAAGSDEEASMIEDLKGEAYPFNVEIVYDEPAKAGVPMHPLAAGTGTGADEGPDDG